MWCLFWRSACSREDNTANAAEEGRLPGDTGATSNTRKVCAASLLGGLGLLRAWYGCLDGLSCVVLKQRGLLSCLTRAGRAPLTPAHALMGAVRSQACNLPGVYLG